MKILVSNHSLVQSGGTETFTYTLIGELTRIGHQVEYFCFEKGEFSERIEKDFNVKFKSADKYDLILANHNTTVDQLYKFGIIIQTCHGIFSPLEQPSKNADGYVAISQEVQKYLLHKGFVSVIIYNGIDCNRYKPIKPLRKENPKVLSLCHSPQAHEIVAEACLALNYTSNILDKYKDRKWDVETMINEHDIIVGLGRSAYEALACGRPVVIYDKRWYSEGLGDGYFIDNFVESLKNNCSGRALKKEFTKGNLIDELKKYQVSHGDIARNYALQSFNIQKTVNEYTSYLNMLLEIRQNNTIRSKSKRAIRNTLIRIPERIKTPIRRIDSLAGGFFLSLKRRFIPK